VDVGIDGSKMSGCYLLDGTPVNLVRPVMHTVRGGTSRSDAVGVPVEAAAGRASRAVSMNDVTRILSAVAHGDAGAAEQLLPLVYDELRRLAAQRLAREMPGQTLQATALVHEAYLRLVGHDPDQRWGASAGANAGAVVRARIRTWMTWPGQRRGTRRKYWPFTRRWISSRQKRRGRPNW
jgi:hypothetical protein